MFMPVTYWDLPKPLPLVAAGPRARLVSILASLFMALNPLSATADPLVDGTIPYVFVLGVAQDAGYPQASC